MRQIKHTGPAAIFAVDLEWIIQNLRSNNHDFKNRMRIIYGRVHHYGTFRIIRDYGTDQ